ncbi:MAG: hypothetical protein H7099_06110 [Gemmatimonadaceae bacterium]|nr:hypothetical protein [Gemmatimonadaceae bacterium]
MLLAPSAAYARHRGAPVRPRAVVRVEITSRLYRTRLDGDATRCGVTCQSLEALLTSDARALFDARYRFVDWRGTGERTADTVVLRIREKPSGGHVEIIVALLGKTRAISSDSVVSFFDDFFEAQKRDRSYWATSRLQRTFADMIGARLDANAARIIPTVIGQLPLAAAVNLPVSDSSSRVDVSADSLRAATSPPVSFLVRVGIEERVQGTVVKRQGELKLINCAEGAGNGQRRYVCRRMEFSVTSPMREVADFFAMSARGARITKESVHIYLYASSTRAVTADGIVAAGDDP